jgi:hypothetical protein
MQGRWCSLGDESCDVAGGEWRRKRRERQNDEPRSDQFLQHWTFLKCWQDGRQRISAVELTGRRDPGIVVHTFMSEAHSIQTFVYLRGPRHAATGEVLRSLSEVECVLAKRPPGGHT